MSDPSELPKLRRRRGVAKASITRIDTRLGTLEGETDRPNTRDSARQLLAKLKEHDADFKKIHLTIVDLIDSEDALSTEQALLDEHDDIVATITVRILALVDSARPASTTTVGERDLLRRRCDRLESRLTETDDALTSLSSEDKCRLEQHHEQLLDFKKEMSEITSISLSLTPEDSDTLPTRITALEKKLFDYSLRHKQLSRSSSTATSPSATDTEPKGVKLPKLDVPIFNGNLLNWTTFWEQFCISIHNRTNLSDAEKFVYLQQALKGGNAKGSIEGLAQSGENYKEAVACLKARYNRPRLIHKAHVKVILDAPPLKDGSGKELRVLHDIVQQHVRALKSMGYEPPGPFITSIVELKLDETTAFEWQSHSQKSTGIPHYQDLLTFLDLRAQATEAHVPDRAPKRINKPESNRRTPGVISSHASDVDARSSNQCSVCDAGKHPLYACLKFKSMSHEAKMSTLRAKKLCNNCLGPGHFWRQCTSIHKCKICQNPHHTLLHRDRENISSTPATVTTPSAHPQTTPQMGTNNAPHNVSDSNNTIFSATTVGMKHNLLMTCRVRVNSPNSSYVTARALLDSASSASFISERLTQNLSLPRTKRDVVISGVAGLAHKSQTHSFTTFDVSPISLSTKVMSVTAAVVPKVTCELPTHPVPFRSEWSHLKGLQLADPEFGCPGRIDLLLGVDVFVNVLLTGRRIGEIGTPTAFETHFGWVLAGSAEGNTTTSHFVSCHVAVPSCDDILRTFWEVEDSPLSEVSLSPEERSVIQHFEANHSRTNTGRFIVPLPKRKNVLPIGESRSQAVHRFLSLERTLHARKQFDQFNGVMQEYFDLGHAELVPPEDMNAPTSEVFYLPMHAVHKQSSTTTKIRAVFDASMKSASGVSLNDVLMVGPTVHPLLVDVLLRFRMHRIALVTDVTKMYRAVELKPNDRDLHRFVWRADPGDSLKDYRMTRVTFGVSSSSFIANMCVKRNAADFAHKYPLASKIVNDSFYVDDCLAGADSVEEGIEVHRQLQGLFSEAEFLLHKWNSSSPAVLEAIPARLRDSQTCLTISDSENAYTRTLGIEWHSVMDHFRLDVNNHTLSEDLTKRALVSDIARTYDVLGWFAPVIVKLKILLQRLWESKVAWDDPVPKTIEDVWSKWRSQLKSLSRIHIPRCYFPKDAHITSLQLHGFSDASEDAYSGVVYLRMEDTDGNVHVALVASKTRVAPIKRLSIPRLELCGAHMLTKLLSHVRNTLNIPIENVMAWTDSTILINWLDGSPRRFKTYVGNRISFIISHIPPKNWNHVRGEQNPADCASRGLYPEELIDHDLWWYGPTWLKEDSSNWPAQTDLTGSVSPDAQKEISLHIQLETKEPIFPLDRFSSYNTLVRVTGWVMRFLTILKRPGSQDPSLKAPLTVQEVIKAEAYWISLCQHECYSSELQHLSSNHSLSSNSALLQLHPFIDSHGVLRVGGRKQHSKLAYSTMHPVILDGKHPLTKLIIQTEHRRLLHAGPTLLMSSLNRRYHVVGGQRIIRSVTRACVTCRRKSQKPNPQLMGQLPIERVTPDIVFQRVGVDYAGPVYVKHGHVRKPTLVKSYICVFVSLTVKAVHLELVSDLTTEAFISTLRRFIARRGKPSLVWSDHGSNFVGAQKELKQLVEFLEDQKTQNAISQFCTSQRIEWKFIPERSPHFGGLWESCVKSMKYHLKRVTSEVKLTFEEYSTVLAQVEACLNSRPMVALSCDDDGLEALTPGHFLIGRPLEALPDPAFSYRAVSLLKRWHLCQNLVRHFWQRWSTDYLASLRRYTKWHKPCRNLSVGDIVVLNEDTMIPTTWPLGRVVEVFSGKDGLVRVANVKTKNGILKRAVHKLALLLPNEP